jgi:hypothetical protein
LRSCIYWAEFERPKVVIPAIANHASYAVDENEFFSNDKTSVCVCESNEYIAALLNSSVHWWLITKSAAERQNRFYELKPMYISSLPIPSADRTFTHRLSILVKKAIGSTGNGLLELERKIDTLVEDLFDLTSDERALIRTFVAEGRRTTSGKSDMRLLLRQAVDSLPPYFESSRLHRLLAEHDLAVGRSSEAVYLANGVGDGLVFDAGRGWYSTIKEPFVLNTKPVRRVIATLAETFPLLDFSCWSTEQIAPYARHLLSRFMRFVYTDTDMIEPVAECLRQAGYAVYADPGKAQARRGLRVEGETVVVRKAISKQPEGREHAAPIEKILVDLVWEAGRLPFLDEAEARSICEAATGAGRVNMGVLLSYGQRRRVVVSGQRKG